jgi:RimJ/RimL family protein N-acetyltransferase
MLIRLNDEKVIRVEKIGLNHAGMLVKFGNKMRSEAPYDSHGLIHKRYTLKMEIKLIKRQMKNHHSPYIAISNGEVVGVADINSMGGELSRHVAYCGYVVAKEFRGTGLAYFLIYAAAKHAKRSIKTVLAAILPQNKASVYFFKHCGGIEVGKFKKTIFSKCSGRYYDEIYMQVPLAGLIKNSNRMWKLKGIKEKL